MIGGGKASLPAVQAARTQNEASDPLVSAFVSASAGSGKTKLLIDRLLRLMLPVMSAHPETGEALLLPGGEPGRIQCLTFTKAAAAEMANRLQTRLGKWVSLPDDALDAELAGLDVPVTPDSRRAARELFVRVLDLPGGMKIGTIHAFCQSLLRRFPLEAAVNPHFTLLEDADAALALNAAIERELAAAASDPARREALGLLAGQVGLDAYLARVRGLGGEAARLAELFARDPAALRATYARLLGAGEEEVDALEARLLAPPEEGRLRAALRAAFDAGTETMRATVGGMLDWLAMPAGSRAAEPWCAALLTKEGTPRTSRGFLPAKVAAAAPEIMAAITAEAERVRDIRAAIAARRLLDLNLALFSLAAPTLARYARDKSARGLVDYDDLIASTRGLLQDPGAAWVLYKLDGGIDHLLLDEVQDTSGMQWEIAGALTAEFFAGEGAREEARGESGRPRTVFAVGDYKQSIYAFQGAEPEGFHLWRDRFARQVVDGAQAWRDPGLNVSFRSVPPVLRLVDAVFARDGAAHGLRAPGEDLPPHVSAREGEGGRVEIWPLVPRGEAGEAVDPWAAPSGSAGQGSPPQTLADELARWIAGRIGQAPQPGQPPLRAGEILVLVPRRSPFLRALIRALKGQGVEVATLVRVALTDQLAVQDLMTLCEALLLPQDDLTLASVLTSPLGGVSDDSLMALAMGRGATPLWTVLRARHAERADWRAAWEMLAALQARVDFATPYQLLADALGRHGGRARVLARLGPEAAEPMDDLLAAALRFEALHPPAMQGFLAWLRASEATVKREPDASADAVRIMTVHGAKGLQARLVVLPDMTCAMRQDFSLLWSRGEEDWPVWLPGGGLRSDVTDGLAAAAREAARAEWNRLLYVALTRASDWLVICGWESGRSLPETAWYGACRSGFEALGAAREPFGGPWGGESLVIEEARQGVAAEMRAAAVTAAAASLPAFFGRAPRWVAKPPVREEALTRPLAPSRPDGAVFGAEPAARSPLDWAAGASGARERALRRGVLVHRLLQIVPDWAAAERRARAELWLAQPARGIGAAEAARLASQVAEILDEPSLAPLFGPGSRAEQALAGIVAGRAVTGQVDRVRVTEEAIYLCDYKTNRLPPRAGAPPPAAYRRQMAAYAALLRQIHPGLPVRASLVWTEGPSVTLLTEEELEAALDELARGSG
ncbi:double-strand break repair helicase AddA [Acidomonas methanolica]|nr:double-strand break repair helicase AddA [Acidomonas methanolica]MCQ9155102.1 double-strand break repair helicase AddA [Acidomonas methanolica]